ncbi:hypothetical protein GCM10009828_034280 [Actinoplanes couchii]|uniref:Uncharacterized protein n=1 Tax=Actinoplanes couchii TaxID=403638 RepID=A0ABQ3X8R8_9ACTN|nr:hypothetical protein Aco03nite_032960 [Actinoplanes couchii]
MLFAEVTAASRLSSRLCGTTAESVPPAVASVPVPASVPVAVPLSVVVSISDATPTIAADRAGFAEAVVWNAGTAMPSRSDDARIAALVRAVLT